MIEKPTLGNLLNPYHPLAPDLGCWVMNEGDGGIVYDRTYRDNNNFDDWTGSPTWVPGGINFDGTSQIITNNSPNFPAIGTGQYTLFIFLNATDSKDQGLVSFDSYDPCFNFDADEHINIYDGGYKGDSTAVVTVGEDSTVAWVRRGTGANETDQYVNGVLDGNVTHADSIGAPSALVIGADRDATTSAYEFGGKIYCVYLYGRALSEHDIARLHANPYEPFKQEFPIWAAEVVSAGTTEIIVGGAVSLSGVSLLANSLTVITKQNLTLTGAALDSSSSVIQGIVGGALSLTGKILYAPLVVIFGSGNLTITGKSLFANLTSKIVGGTLSLSGKVLNITHTVPIVGGALSLSAANFFGNLTSKIAKGTLTLTGQTLTSLEGNVKSIASGALTLTGKAFSSTLNPLFKIASGALSLTGKGFTLAGDGFGSVWKRFTNFF